MADNNNNNTQAQWWTRISLKEWGALIGGIGFFYLNIVSAVETIKTSLNEIKIEIKEDRTVTREMLINYTKLTEKINSFDERLKKIENEKQNINYR